MKTILVVALIAPLSGCWFVYIPGSMVSAIGDGLAGLQGQHCVSETAKVGDRASFPNGAGGTIKKIEGYSSRCTGSTPVRAVVALGE